MAIITNLTNETRDPFVGLTPLEIKRLNYPLWGHQLVGVYLMFVGIFGFTENLLVIFTFAKNKQLLSATNIFILGVAIGDFCMAALGNPLAFTSALNGKWWAGEFFCYWEGFIVYTFGLSQLYLLVAVSIDRYVVIAKPLLAPKITKKVAKLSVGACFAFSAIWSIPPFFGWGNYGLEAPGTFCGLHWDDRSAAMASYVVSITLFCFVIPMGVMVFCYYHVFMTVN